MHTLIMAEKWQYLMVELSNKGRIVYENGIVVRSHTKKSNLSKLPKDSWNEKGREMILSSKGTILNDYGAKGWELVSTKFREDNENTYIFKKKN
jgi:uncharacterized protein (AIM24 family)